MSKLQRMQVRLEEIQDELKDKLANKRYVEDQIKEVEERISTEEENKNAAKIAREFLQSVATQTQNQIVEYFESTGTHAIQPLSVEPISVKMDFLEKRGKTECDLYYQDKNGKRLSPMFSSGYGLNDMSSIAFRLLYCNILKTNKILVLDEPMKQVSEGYIEEACEILKTLVKSEGFQVILISNAYKPFFEEIADKVFYVEQGEVY